MTYRRTASRIIYNPTMQKKKKQHKNHEFHQWIIDVALGTIVSISVSNSSIIPANSIRARPIKTRVSLKQIDKLGEIRSNDQPQNGHDKCRRAKQEFQFAPRTWPEYRLTKIPRFLYGSPSAWTNSRPVKHVRNICRDFRCFFTGPRAVREWKFRGDFHLWSRA